MNRAQRQDSSDASLEKAQQLLMASVTKGVTGMEEGVYEFEDPGLPLDVLIALPIVLERKFMYPQSWHSGKKWTEHGYAPRKRRIRIPIKGSFNRTFAEQSALLAADEEVCETREVVAFLVVNALAIGKRLLSDCYVRTADKGSDDRRVVVGSFDSDGLDVHNRWDGSRHPDIGLASSRET